MKKIQLLSDNHFQTGFHLLGISPVIDGRTFYRHIDYNGEALKSDRTIWQMAQWWTPFNVLDATYEKKNGTHFYKTPSRLIGVNPEEGKLIMNLSGSKEYKGGTRTGMGEPWSHFLIEQDFEKSVSINELSKLNAKLTFNIESVKDLNGKAYDPNLHAAQLVWYFVITDVGLGDGKYIGYGDFKEFFWFGVPIYDSRHTFIDASMHVDEGGVGTTGRLIYSISNKNYLKEPIVFGKQYTFEVDILPFVEKAKAYALENGYLKKHDKAAYQIGYMNFGWELPGAFDVKSYIKDLNVEAVLK